MRPVQFLVGPNKLDVRNDDTLGGVFVERCRFLEETNCKVCKVFDHLAGSVPLRRSKNRKTQDKKKVPHAPVGDVADNNNVERA